MADTYTILMSAPRTSTAPVFALPIRSQPVVTSDGPHVVAIGRVVVNDGVP